MNNKMLRTILVLMALINTAIAQDESEITKGRWIKATSFQIS